MGTKTALNVKGSMTILIMVSIFLALPNLADAVTQQWVKRYDGPHKMNDQAIAIALDTNGNIYVTGFSYNKYSYSDYVTIKYNSAGQQQWVRRYDGPSGMDDHATAIAVDTKGNVYVTGTSSSTSIVKDYATIKYNTNGQLQWIRRYNGSRIDTDQANAIAVDTKGNVYVTGQSKNNHWNYDYTTIKYDTNGKRQWVKRYDGPGAGNDYATAIALDAKANVYVTGHSANRFFSNKDYATIKYDTNGKQQWVRRYDGPGKESFYDDDHATAIALDTKGNVYVTGYSYNKYSNIDYATIKYNNAGKQQWVRMYDGPYKKDDHATAIAVDTKGNVYVTGHIENESFDKDYATIKYNTHGQRKWVRTYDGPGKGEDQANAIAVDNKGNVYVTGQSENNDWNNDYATIMYNTNGERQWVRTYNGPSKGEFFIDDNANAIAVDTNGNVYVTGQSCYGTFKPTSDYATIKYAP